MYMPHFAYAFIHCFHVWAVVNNNVMNLGVRISLQVPGFPLLEYILRIGTTGSSDISIFSILKDCHIVFYSDCIILHFLTKSASGHQFPHILAQHLVSAFFYSGHPGGYKCDSFFKISFLWSLQTYTKDERPPGGHAWALTIIGIW